MMFACMTAYHTYQLQFLLAFLFQVYQAEYFHFSFCHFIYLATLITKRMLCVDTLDIQVKTLCKM